MDELIRVLPAAAAAGCVVCVDYDELAETTADVDEDYDPTKPYSTWVLYRADLSWFGATLWIDASTLTQDTIDRRGQHLSAWTGEADQAQIEVVAARRARGIKDYIQWAAADMGFSLPDPPAVPSFELLTN